MDLQPQMMTRPSEPIPSGSARRASFQPHSSHHAADRLACHMDIAWDFDGTLVDHPAAPLLHRFIRRHRQIRHVIVTFRTKAMANQVWSELGRFPGAPDRSCFDAVINIPGETWNDVRMARERWGLMRHLLPHSAAEARCRRWKGLVCRDHGLTALVDDMTAMVAAGCRAYDVALFHPADFLPA